MTKVCIFGAGSIGGYIAACLKKTDVDVSLVARGPHKEAIEKKGLTFIKNEKVENCPILPFVRGNIIYVRSSFTFHINFFVKNEVTLFVPHYNKGTHM